MFSKSGLSHFKRQPRIYLRANDPFSVQYSHFEGWDSWKKAKKEGYDSKILFEREGNKIVAHTGNAGIYVKRTTTVKTDVEKIYVALTGDQVALTNIRIKKNADK